MSGLKNLMPKGIFADANYATLKKKSEDFKKSINTFVEHLQQINNIYQNYYGVFENNIGEVVAYFPYDDEYNPKFFKEILGIFRCLNKELRNFIEKESNNQKSILQLSDLFMIDFNVLVEKFHQKCKEYTEKEQNLVESCEDYFKIYRQMLTNIESYKNSFMDVKIIYNKDEKIKRYNECVATYKNIEEDLAIINKKVEQLNKHKDMLAQKYIILEKQLTNFTSSFASRYIDELKKFAECLFELEKTKLHIILDRLQQIDKITPQNFLVSSINLRYQECISCQVKLSECQFIPCFIYYFDSIKEEARPLFKKMIVIYYQQVSIRIEKRKMLDKKIIEYMQRYLKTLDKNLMESYRQTMLNFDKMRKKIGEVFGNRWLSFYKIISALFENSIENTGRLMKRVEGKIKVIEAAIAEQAILFDSFLKDLKNFIEKCISKKIYKKYTQNLEQKSQALLQQQASTTRQEITDISAILRKQISKVNESILKSDNNLKAHYLSYLNDIKASISQFHTFCDEIEQNYYREDIYSKNYQLCTDEIALSVKKQMKFFQEMPFSILKSNSRIIFDGEFNKIEGFKKIKKPKQLEELLKENNRESQQTGVNAAKRDTDIVSIANSNVQSVRMFKQLRKQCFLGENTNKHAQFLSKRIEFLQNEKYIKSSSCALSDRIILAGRIFVTSHRLFFHSKFNRSNIFFGETFIEVPKKDIKKIEKKASSLFINNAISITTVNGELFFISFLSRDKFFNILKNTFEVNSQELFFEEEQLEEDEQEEQLQFEDDMKEETSLEREKSIIKQIAQFNYVPVYTYQFELYGLNPVKFLKVFQLDQQMTINRAQYPSFSYYLKDVIGENKQIEIENWSPNPMDYLNTTNIKQITPEVFTRKIGSIVPLPNSGIPFMPKTSYTTEHQTLFIVNKHKYIMEMVVKSNGVPYCDTFDLRLKKTVQQSGENKVKMTAEVFVNFNQNVMVKSTIQSKSIETSKENFEKNGNEIKSYLKVLQKKLLKNNKKETPEEKIAEQAETIQELQKQLQALKNERKANLIVMESQDNLIKKGKMALIILGVLTILQFYLLAY